MSHGLLQVLRYFFLAVLWLFFLYAARMVIVEVRRSKVDTSNAEAQSGLDARAGLKLRVLEPDELKGLSYDLGGEVTLGRLTACVVPLEDDTFASSVHAVVFVRNGELWLEDLGSTNGTYLNDRRLGPPVRIRRGDRLKVGRTILEVAR